MHKAGLFSTGFSQAFSELLERTGVTCYQISQYTHIDQAYLSRLKSGKKKNPSPEIVPMIGIAFVHFSKDVGIEDIDALLDSISPSLMIKSPHLIR